jgi:hypothetical protein
LDEEMSGTIEFKLGGTLRFITEPSRAGCFVTVRCGSFIITVRGDDMAYTLASGMQVHLQVSYVDASGNPAVIDGDVAWESSDPGVADVVVDIDDSTKVTVRAVGPTGQVQVSATADADLGDGVRQIITPMDVTVAAGEAVAGTISPVGPAEPIS